MATLQQQTGALPNISMLVAGSFQCNGSSDPTTIDCLAVSKVTHTGTGTYKVSLKEPWRACLSIRPTLGLAVAADRECVLISHQVTSSSDPSFVIKVVDSSGVAHDVAAATNNQIFLRCIFSQGAYF